MPDGSGAVLGFVSAAEEGASVSVVVGWSGSVSDAVIDVVVADEATARELSDRNVNCELTDGVTNEVDVEREVGVVVDVIEGKLMMDPLVIVDEVAMVDVLLDAVMLAEVVATTLVIVDVPLADPLAKVVTVEVPFVDTPMVEVVPLPAPLVIVELYICRCHPYIPRAYS